MTFTIPWKVAYGIVAVSIIVCNLFFLFVFCKSDRLKRMRSSLFLIGLTAADLIVGTVTIPMYMVLVWPGSELANSRALNRSYHMIDVVSGFASLFVLAVIALERVYSVFWPFKHRTLSKTPYYVGLIASWFLAALQGMFYLLQWKGVKFVYSIFPCMSAVVIVVTVSYLAMWMKIKKKRLEGLHHRRAEQESKLAKTLAILTGIFLVTWLPFHIVNTIYNLCAPCTVNTSPHFVFAVKLLHYSNSLANPIVYSFRFPEVRRTLGSLFCRCRDVVQPTEFRMAAARQGEEQ